MLKNPKLKKVLKIVGTTLLSLLIVLVLVFTLYAFNSKNNDGIPKFFGKSYLTILSNSMDVALEEYDSKGFERGDMIVIERYQWYEAAEKQFEPGDIITFEGYDDEGRKILITHRIKEVKTEEVNTVYYITQGDVYYSQGRPATVESGYAEKVYSSKVVGKHVKTIPNVGWIFIFLQSSLGFLLAIVLPLLILFIIEIFNFVKVYKEYKLEKNPSSQASPEDLQKEIERLKAQLEQKASNE